MNKRAFLKNIQWKIKFLRKCRFLSLVVVELVLTNAPPFIPQGANKDFHDECSFLCGQGRGPKDQRKHFFCTKFIGISSERGGGTVTSPGGTKNQPEVFQTEVFSWTSARHVRAEMLVFPGLGGPDRSFWPDVRRDVRPKTSVFGLIFRF